MNMYPDMYELDCTNSYEFGTNLPKSKNIYELLGDYCNLHLKMWLKCHWLKVKPIII